MKKRNLLLLLFIVTLTACSSSGTSYDGPEIKMKRKISDGRILLSEFFVEGKNIPDKTNEYLSQRLFDLLFIETGLHVFREGTYPDSLEVKYVLGGSLTYTTSGMSFDPDSRQKLIMTLRINDYQTKEIVGVVTASCRFKNGMQEKIDELLEMCVDELREFR